MNEASHSAADKYYRAMRRKAEGIDDLIAVFDDDAVYVEPFSDRGRASAHTGKSNIAEFLRKMPENTPPDMEVHVDRIDRDANVVRAVWTCTSAAFPTMYGRDLFEIKNGKISRLETTLIENPNA